MTAARARALGHGEDDTPFTHRGFGDADVVLEVPVPGRVALVQIESTPGEHLRLWRIERPGGPVESCAYAGPAEGSDASILTVDERGRMLRAVRVRCAGAWSLRLKDPDAAREFERSIEGVDSEVLRYTGSEDPGSSADRAANPPGPGRSRIRRLLDRLRLSSGD